PPPSRRPAPAGSPGAPPGSSPPPAGAGASASGRAGRAGRPGRPGAPRRGTGGSPCLSSWVQYPAPCGTDRSALRETIVTMLETSARLRRLLPLLQARSDWPGPRLAARLEVTTRTVRNDVERLRRLGYPVAAAPGVAGGYRLGAG